MTQPLSDTTTTFERLMLQISIFLIPTNLSYHFYHAGAFMNGRLIDYALPKLYLSDIPILLLIGILIYRNINKFDISNIYKSKFAWLVAYLLVVGLVVDHSVSSGWYVLKVIQLYLLGKYLTSTYKLSMFIATIRPALIVGILTQTTVSIYQYINQKSVYGYYFLGEVDLNSPGIALQQRLGRLEVLPYGTTSHPNILAGLLVIFILLFFSRTHNLPKNVIKKTLSVLLIGLSIATIYLTKSISALSGYIASFFIVIIFKHIGKINPCLLIQIPIYISLVISMLIYPIGQQINKLSDNPSFYVRYEINKAAIDAFLKNPLSGVGPNQSARITALNPIDGQRTLTLQPPHHGLLLMLAETGLIGTVLLYINFKAWLQSSLANTRSLTSYAPAISLFYILLLDHYPLTLQTGQLLLTISLTLPLLKNSDRSG